MVTGSPFYPLGAASAEDDIRAGYPDMWATTFAGNGSADRWRLAAEAVWRVTGPCHFVAFLSFPLSAAWLLMTAGGRHVCASGTRPSATRAAVAVAAVGACGVLLITPFAVEDSPGSLNQLRWGYCPVRYGMCFLCLAMVGFGVLLSDLIGVAPRFMNVGAPRPVPVRWAGSAGNRITVLFLGVVAAGIVTQLTQQQERLPVAPIDSLLIGVNIFFATATIQLSTRASSWRLPTVLFGAAIMLGAGSAVGIHYLSARWHAGYARAYDYAQGDGLFEYMADQIPAGGTVCVLDLRPYPFFGSARQFRVCQPPFGQSAHSCEGYLRSRSVRLLVTRFSSERDDANRWKAIRTWLQGRPSGLVPVENRPWSYTAFMVQQDLLRPVRQE